VWLSEICIYSRCGSRQRIGADHYSAINQLSGGSKTLWLSRAHCEAFLVRSANGGVVAEAEAGEIVDRILDVLAHGAASLSRMDDVAAAAPVCLL